MKTYTFFYSDCFNSSKNCEIDSFKKYVIPSSRFDSAFQSFSQFLRFHESDYIDFSYNYNVFNGHRTQVRSLTYNDILYLVCIKEEHNTPYWKEKHD